MECTPPDGRIWKGWTALEKQYDVWVAGAGYAGAVSARALAEKGKKVLVLERDSSGQLLYDTAREILGSPQRRRQMAEAMGAMGSVDAAEKIYAAVMSLRAKGRK